MKQLLVTIVVLTLLSGCIGQQSINNQDNKNKTVELNDQDVLKVYVDEKGEITSNGNHISLEDLDVQLKELKDKNGTVYYSRANVTNNPPEESMMVIKLIVKYELPIKFYTDKTFKTPAKI